MNRQEVANVIEMLTDIVDGWNEGRADEDRGRGNDAITLTVFDDGSGKIGRRCSWPFNENDDLHSFDNMEELAKILVDEGVELEGEKS